MRTSDLKLLALCTIACGCATTAGRLSRDVIQPLDPSADTAQVAYLQELVAKGHGLQLSQKAEWLRLGHWRTTLTGFLESEADGPNFFLSPWGKTNPAAELDATLRAFFAHLPADATDVQHPICQFPARYRWLDRVLHFDPALLPKPACTRRDEFYKRVDAESLSFVFSSYYLNNPASVFGHTFVRIVKRSQHDDPAERRELLDFAIEFSATVDTKNPIVYGIKGVAGLFPGTFRNIPYYYKVRQYNDYEARDLYEYELDFTPEEIEMFLAHVWELGSTYFDYFYVSENCSYHLLGALEAIRPDLDLLGHMHWPVVPADTIKALYANAKLVKGVKFRPSLRRQFAARVTRLDDSQRAVVEALVTEPTKPLPPTINGTRAIDVFDAAQDLVDILYAKELVNETDSRPARIKQTLLERRAEIPLPSEPVSVAMPWKLMPQLGHDSRRVGLGVSVDDSGAKGIALDARLALHDLADPTLGYPELSQIEFLPMRARIRTDDALDGRKRFELASLSFVRIVSLTPQDRFDRKLSWKADLGMVRNDDEGCAGYCYLGQLTIGTGTAFSWRGDGLVAFATADARIASGPALEGIEGIPLRAGLGPAGGIRLRLTCRLVSLTTGELFWLPTQTPKWSWQTKTILRLGVTKNFGVNLEGALDARVATGSLGTLFYF